MKEYIEPEVEFIEYSLADIEQVRITWLWTGNEFYFVFYVSIVKVHHNALFYLFDTAKIGIISELCKFLAII